MKFNCPFCQKESDFMEVQLESDLHAIIKLMPSFGQHAHVVMGYCYLFGVSPLKVKAKKLRILLDEIKRLFDAEAFTFDKARYAISRAGIAEALNTVVKRNFSSPLSNHNYLKQVMVTIAEDEARKNNKQAERDLRKKEDILMSGNRCADHEGQVEVPPLKTMPAACLTDEQIRENKRRLKEMADKIGA